MSDREMETMECPKHKCNRYARQACIGCTRYPNARDKFIPLIDVEI
jgi:hypothetical protein